MSTAFWLVHSGIALAGRTPPGVRHAVASTVTSASYLGWRSKRLVTQENMGKVLGLPANHALSRRAALSSWSNYGRTAASLICLPHTNMTEVDDRTQDLTEGMTWRELLESAMAPGRGAVITTGHFGSWDLAGAIIARAVPLSAVADTFKDPQLNALLQGHRRDKSVHIIPTSDAVHLTLRELAGNRAVAIVADRPVAAGRGVEVRFFGHQTFVPAGSAAIAVRSGAPVVPGFVWYQAPGYAIRAFPPMFPRPTSSAAERAEEIRRLTQYMFTCQEQVVRQFPTQWFMFRRFWTRPAQPCAPDGSALRAA